MTAHQTLLLPCYLLPTFKQIFTESIAFHVSHSETYEGVINLIRYKNGEIDLAIKWQIGESIFPVLNLFGKYQVNAPIFLLLNSDGTASENIGVRGYSGALIVPKPG